MKTRQYTTFVPSQADSTRTLRYAIVGTGMMGREHLGNIAHLDDSVVTALIDPHAESVRLARPLCDADVSEFEDLESALESVDFDAVIIASPNHTHAQIARDAIQAGKHVLIEKPMATSVGDCLELERLANGYPHQVVSVGLEYRFMAPTMWLLERVRSGEVGDVRLVTIVEHRFPFLDKVGAWNRFNRNTGGTLVEKCCHFFDLMYQVVQREPVAVMATSATRVNHVDETYDGEVPDIVDNAYVIVEFDGDARGMLELCMFAEGSKDEQKISVVGDLGKAEVGVPSHECSIGLRESGRSGVATTIEMLESPYEGLHHGSSYREHVAFRSAILGRTTVVASLRDGTRSVAIGVAAQRSIAEGRRVTLEEVGYGR